MQVIGALECCHAKINENIKLSQAVIYRSNDGAKIRKESMCPKQTKL